MTRLIFEEKYDFKDVLIVPKRSSLSSRNDVILERDLVTRNSNIKCSITPIVLSNMDGVGTFEMASVASKEYNMLTALTKHYSVEDLVNFYTHNADWAPTTVCYSLGITENDLKKYNEFKRKLYVKFVIIDVANFYTTQAISFLENFRINNPNTVIVAGNVATPEITEQLILSGADFVKIGVGSGNACSTRLKAGVGYPQLSAIIECADAAHGLGGHIIGDGGITCPADFVKGFCAGADIMMAGSFFAGCTEGGGEIINRTYLTNELDKSVSIPGNNVYKHKVVNTVQFYGMSSKTAQEKHNDSLKDYRASEGRVIEVPYKGSVKPLIQDLLGSIRSAATYIGASKIKDLPKRATFCKVNQQISTLYGVGDVMG